MTPSSGDTAWVLTSAALVLLMTPGLALFYGGMVRAKSVLNMMMMSFGALGLISVLWVLYGYSLAFGDDVGGGLLGNLDFVGLKGLLSAAPLGGVEGEAAGIPPLAFVGFQAVFAIITVALISGAIADRAKFGSWMVFAGVWATIVYFPVAHWVFSFDGYTAEVGGWIANDLKAIDFAGGTAVHINAGAAGLALALVLGKRIGFGKEPMRPHNLTLVMLGAGLLWFGWFGFNAGSALGAGDIAAVAWMNTLVATAAASLGWLRDGADPRRARHHARRRLRRRRRPGRHHPGLLGGQPGGRDPRRRHRRRAVRLAVGLKYKFGYDDSLDVVGVHLVGGIVGTLLIGFLGTSASAGRCRRPVLRRRRRPAVAAGRRGRCSARLLVRPGLRHRDRHRQDDRLPDRRRGRGRPASTSRRTPSRPTSSGPSRASGFHTGAGAGTTKEKVDA